MSHSLSPVLHRAGYRATGLTGWTYEAIDCSAAALPDLVAGLDGEWTGLSVTMPGKSAAARTASTRSPRVDLLGVANTLVRTADGWHAENTDVDGVLGALAAVGAPVCATVLVLGGGGTALAVTAALAERHRATRLIAAGRRPESTSGVVDLASALDLPIESIGFSLDEISSVAGTVDLVVSTVPAGAADHLAGALAGVPVLFDAVYHPWPTPLAAAATPERLTITGLDLLLHQALRQFELITGVPAPASAMRDALRSATGTGLALPLRAEDEPGD